ncbi:hypothetical protein ACS0TY_003123 [Phlomoides rotata]
MDTVDQATRLKRVFMVVSRLHRETSFLHTLSCKQDSLISAAKYLMEVAPLQLSSNNLVDVNEVISAIFVSLPSDFIQFIKCVAEVHRNECGGHASSQEDYGRAIKEKVLELVHETRIYKYVTDTFESSKSCLCKRDQTLGHIECLPDILVPLSDREPSSFYTVVSCRCSAVQQAGNDILTELLLSLPPETWSAIKNEKVFKEISGLVFLDTLPSLLQDEVLVLHIRGQILVLKGCYMDLINP